MIRRINEERQVMLSVKQTKKKKIGCKSINFSLKVNK